MGGGGVVALGYCPRTCMRLEGLAAQSHMLEGQKSRRGRRIVCRGAEEVQGTLGRTAPNRLGKLGGIGEASDGAWVVQGPAACTVATPCRRSSQDGTGPRSTSLAER